MRKMYSEEQVRAIAQSAVVSALAAIGVEPNEFDGIDVNGCLRAETITGQGAAFFDADPTAYVGSEANLMANTAYFGYDPKEAMGNLWVSQGTVRAGGSAQCSPSIIINNEGILAGGFDSALSFFKIDLSCLSTTDPQIPGALWYDNQTGTLKISMSK